MFWISRLASLRCLEGGRRVRVEGAARSSRCEVAGGNGSKEEEFTSQASPPSSAKCLEEVARAELARRPTYRACGCSQWVESGPPAVPLEVPLESLIQSLGRVGAESSRAKFPTPSMTGL
ncbi:hypothetical protein SMAC4_13461 [Sordaria macrospora]|uniref:uncharacterized protein n=1 Tax=Sordaria macrospora TaxID=5147 RepID=UPI002B30962C|nr:hypothetical protein SMAC4_13461 [Sordaria macrospora]